PVRGHGELDRQPGPRPAEEARGGDPEQAEHDEDAQGDERRLGHACFRYSGRQRSKRVSTCLMPSAMTMPIAPRATSATIMSAAFRVPSDWMMRKPSPPPDSPPRNSPTTTPISAKEIDGVSEANVHAS